MAQHLLFNNHAVSVADPTKLEGGVDNEHEISKNFGGVGKEHNVKFKQHNIHSIPSLGNQKNVCDLIMTPNLGCLIFSALRIKVPTYFTRIASNAECRPTTDQRAQKLWRGCNTCEIKEVPTIL